MADEASKDAAAKERIIKHMNSDHQRELSHYLRHYAKLPASAARKPSLIDITFTHMHIRSSSGPVHSIKIEPPMTSWSDARLRAVDMDTIARRHLGIGSIYITRYLPPRSTVHRVLFVLCLYTVLSFVLQSLGFINHGSVAYAVIDRVFPGGAVTYKRVQTWIAVPVIVVHAAEAAWMSQKCEQFGVEKGSGLWWKWVGSTAVEGFGAHMRFGSEVRRLEREKESKKH